MTLVEFAPSSIMQAVAGSGRTSKDQLADVEVYLKSGLGKSEKFFRFCKILVASLDVSTYIVGMTIDEEIKQTNWESLRQKAMVNTMFTSRVLEAANTTMLKEHHLTLPQYNILRILRGRKGNPSTVKLLTERMLDKSSNASRLVDTLLEKGLVQRVSCPNDRRAVGRPSPSNGRLRVSRGRRGSSMISMALSNSC